MDLLSQLKTLRDTTNSPDVKSICESHIEKIQSGETTVNSQAILESIQEAAEKLETPKNEVNPIQILRENELEKSRSAAQRLMESWGGIDSNRMNNSGSYVDGRNKESDVDTNLQNSINESLSALAQKDSSVQSFLDSQKVNDLGIYEAVLNIKGFGIYEHPQIKILCERYNHLIKNNNLPEFLVAESFVGDLKNFTWDSKIKNIYESLNSSVSKMKPEIEVSKAIYAIKNNAGSDFYAPVLESLNKWLVSENKSVSLLSKEVSRWSFNPVVRGLMNNLSLLESSSEKLSIPVNIGNSSVKRLYSPVLTEGGKTIFTIGNNIFEGSSSGLRRITKEDFENLPESFLSVLNSFYEPYVKVDESALNIFVGKSKFSILDEGESINIYSNNTKVNFTDKNHLAKLLSFEISGTPGINESKVVFDTLNLFENFNTIVELDFAKRIESKVFEGASVNMIKWDGKLYLNRINESMRENSIYEVNGTQATTMVKEFLKYDISEGLTEFLQGEDRIKSIMINDRSKIMENISIVENEIMRLNTVIQSNPLFTNSEEIQRAKNLLEKELNNLRGKWSAINEEIEKIQNGQVEIPSINEDEKFNVGDYIKVKESGNTGKIISVDSTSGSYTVLMDNGRTGSYKVDEIVDIEQALADAGERNQEKDMPQEDEFGEDVKEGLEMAKAPTEKKGELNDKSPLATMKKNISVAPSSKEQYDKSKLDIENEKHANLQDAPEGTSDDINYSVNKEIGYNIRENDIESTEERSQNMAVAPSGNSPEVSEADIMKTNQQLAVAPGQVEGDAGYKNKYIDGKAKNPDRMDGDPNFASAPGDDMGKELGYKIDNEMGYNVAEKADIMPTNQQLAVAPGQVEGDAGYKNKYIDGKAKNPDRMDGDPNFASAPGDDMGKELGYKIDNEMGYNVAEKADIMPTNQELAVAPGTPEGYANYAAKTIHAEEGKPEVSNDKANLAVAPTDGTESETKMKVNSEMGYNIQESEESKKN